MKILTAFMSFLFSMALMGSVQAYDVKCADMAYWDNKIQNSVVEKYVVFEGSKAVETFFTGINYMAPQGTQKVMVLYNPENNSPKNPVGIVTFKDKCAHQDTLVAPKMVVDQTLIAMIQEDLIE